MIQRHEPKTGYIDEPPDAPRRFRRRPTNDDAFFESEDRRRLYDERHAAEDPLAAVETFPGGGFFKPDAGYQPRLPGEPCIAIERIVRRGMLRSPYAPTALEAEEIIRNRDTTNARSRDIGRMVVGTAQMEEVIEAEVDGAFSLQDVAWWITNTEVRSHEKLYWLNSFSTEWMERHEDIDEAGIVPARRAIPRGVTHTDPHWGTYLVEETRRRTFDEDVDRKRRLAPIEAFPNEMGFFGPPREQEKRSPGEPCRAIVGVIAKNCAGWIERPCAIHTERVMRSRKTSDGDIAIGGMMVREADEWDFISADRSRAFSLQDVAWWMKRIQSTAYRKIYWLNMFAEAER